QATDSPVFRRSRLSAVLIAGITIVLPFSRRIGAISLRHRLSRTETSLSVRGSPAGLDSPLSGWDETGTAPTRGACPRLRRRVPFHPAGRGAFFLRIARAGDDAHRRLRFPCDCSTAVAQGRAVD